MKNNKLMSIVKKKRKSKISIQGLSRLKMRMTTQMIKKKKSV